MLGESSMVQQHGTVQQYVVYCDESCHDVTAHHKFMAIGGLWVPRQQKADLSKSFARLCRSVGLRGEVKWKKVSKSRLEDYKRLADFFFDQKNIRFRTIVVEQAKVKLTEFHDSDAELAFYKFYYEMLIKWLETSNQYLILLDLKSNQGADRYTDLRTWLERKLGSPSSILDLTIIDSKETPLAQLCDLLTGAVAAAYNGTRRGSAKEALVQHIASRAGFHSLKTATSSSEDKFNIFKIDLR